MNTSVKNTSTLIFAALLPIVLGLTFFMVTGNNISNETDRIKTAQWAPQIDEATFHADTLGRLSAKLYDEAQGERRPVILTNLLMQITHELNQSGRVTARELTDVLRDLSLEHPNDIVRLTAYEAMLIALETENQESRIDGDMLVN